MNLKVINVCAEHQVNLSLARFNYLWVTESLLNLVHMTLLAEESLSVRNERAKIKLV